MANKKLQLRDAAGNLLFPRASLDNLQRSVSDGSTVILAELTEEGKLPAEYFPDGQVDVINLLTIAASAPATCATGDKYYNTTYNRIYTATGTNTWNEFHTPTETGALPEMGKIYVNLNTDTLWRYNGSDALVELSAHINVIQNIDGVEDASTEEVPSEKAVAAALDGKQNTLTPATPLDINSGNTVSLKYGQGLDEVSETLVVPQSFVVETVSNQMMEDTIAATPEQALVQGGTVYTIMGSYEVTDEIRPSASADDTFIATEKAVRDAVNAYVATGGTEIVAGDGITVENQAINIDDATADEVLTNDRVITGTTTHEAIDDKVVTPDNLRGALSVGQAVDVSCNPIPASGQANFATSVSYDDGTTWVNTTSDAYKADGSSYLGEFIIERASAVASTNYSFGWQVSNFPKYASGLKYLLICDVKAITGTMNLEFALDNASTGVIDGVPTKAANVTSASGYTHIATLSSSVHPYLMFRSNSSGSIKAYVKNWRQYEVTALTDEAIAYLAQLPDPDAFFRSQDAYSINNKYLVKQDMVCPFIPVISMPDNSDLTIGAGLAYSLKYTDNNTHKITVDTFPENGYGWDAHLRLFVNNTSLIQFMPPLNLLDPLTPNAGQNLTVKFRSGQANVYVDDIDVGYVVTVDGGTENGSLFYGINNTTDEYIVFSNALDGSVVELAGTTIGRAFNLVGNGSDKTIIQSNDIQLNNTVTYAVPVTLTNLTIEGSKIWTLTSGIYSDTITGNNIVINNCTQSTASVLCMFIHELNGSTISNCYLSGDWGFTFSGDGTTMTNCLITGNTAYNRLVFANTGGSTTSVQTISGSTFSDNMAPRVLDAYGNGLVNVTGCTFASNSADSVYTPVTISVTDGRPARAVFTDCVFDKSDIGVGATSDSTIKATLTFSGVNILNSTVSGAGNIVFANGSTVTSTGDGSADAPRGVLKEVHYIAIPDNFLLQNIRVTGSTYANTSLLDAGSVTNHITYKNCTFDSCSGTWLLRFANRNTNNLVEDCVFSDIQGYCVGVLNNNTYVRIKNSTVHQLATGVGGWINLGYYFIGNVEITGRCFCVADGECNVRIKPDSIITIANATYPATISGRYPGATLTIGSYNEDETIYTVGGTATIVHTGGSTVLSGIGTYINSDGTNDFSTPYMVVNTSSSGSGSLLTGIVGSARYLVVDHTITDTSAVLSDDVSGRVMFITTGDGRTIVGGTVSVPEGSTVSVHTTQDEHGAAQVAGSTVTVTGGSTTLSGTCILGGTFSPTGGLVISNGSTVSGVGSGVTLQLDNILWLNDTARRDVTLKNMTISCSSYIADRAMVEVGHNTRLTGCTFTDYRARYGAVSKSNQLSAISYLENCLINQPRKGATGENVSCALDVAAGTLSLSGCTVHGKIGMIGTIILTKTNRFVSITHLFSGTNTGTCVISADAVCDFREADNMAIMPAATATDTITIETGAKYIPFGGSTAVAFTAGTYTKIYRDGTCEE